MLGLFLLATVLVVGAVLGLYVSRLQVSRRPLRRIAVYVNAAGFLAMFLLAGYLSWWWGGLVRHDPSSVEGRGPIALSLAVPVTEGEVTLRNRDVCVLRVADRVLVTKAEVLIEAEPRAFRPRDCF
jgi:hypothetical protein